ncbi:glutamate receptor 1.2-like [Pistacia vera]|uniref:glutamate receptor 1.2-like n=1 Tax=Pistacia vera TaxID=55513 RepID=UPI0012638150|nr:glutamate receptor 1.2-like [Pistacia vera]
MEIDVGLILDIGSLEGRMMQSSISMAISDFYRVNGYYKTRIVLRTSDSKGQHLLALSSAFDLLENFNLGAIIFIGAQSSMETKLLGELGDKAKIPIISFCAPSTSPFSNKSYPYLVQIAQDETSQVAAIAAIVEAFKWRYVIAIHEDNDEWGVFILRLVESLEGKNIHIAYKSSLAVSSADNQINEELQELMAFGPTVFIVHMSPILASRLFMINVRSSSIEVMDSMKGMIGLKSYVPPSKELHNFTSRWRKKFLLETDMEVMELTPFCILAYDVAWGLAKAVERARPKEILLIEILLRSKFKGLSGDFQFINGKLVLNAFEIVNMIGKGERRVGFWTPEGKIARELYSSIHGRELSLSNTSGELEDIIWPGGSATIPKGTVTKMSSRKLRIAVPRNGGFPELVNVDRNLQSNVTSVTGFCIDVFKAAIEEVELELEIEVDYEFIPFLNATGENIGTYSELIDEVYLQKYDGAVGDITMTENRSLYVDFTITYTDLGVGTIAPKNNKNMWIFLKPLTGDLWLSSAGLFILTGIVIWLIERPINNEFQGPTSHQIGMIFWFSFSTLVFAHKEKLLSNFSRFVVIVWVFVVLILTSSYTATLTSMITVQQIQLNSKENYIGYQTNSFIVKGVISNLNFKNSNLQPFSSPEEYANALSRGSKKGGVSSIIDEIPYIKIFLAKYSADYAMIGSTSTANGFAFAFRKGSPLVPYMSRAIAKLRENGKLMKMENEWFKRQSTFASEDDDTSSVVKPLTLDSFRGLFLISGVSSALAVAVLYGFMLYKNWHFVKNFNLRDIMWRRIKFVIEYLSINN